ncbi:hypothetical protein [Nocardia sp. NPDC047038]|uniref:hypothetical protein n=1 Tax=Nocardia sp. NPDC047038 TaxID=3154338 RepID=UPI0033C25722
MPTYDPAQFARLIAHLHAMGTFTDDTVTALAAAMNLRPDELTELIDHADTLSNTVPTQLNNIASAKSYRGHGATVSD